MTIQVEYLTQLRDAAGIAQEEYQPESAATFMDLLAAISMRHGDAMRDLLFDEDGRPRPSTLVFVDGQHLRVAEAGALPDGTEVILGTPISGGAP